MINAMEIPVTSFYALTLAEELVDEHGDLNWFAQHYTICRETMNVRDSVIEALRQQDLLDLFVQELARRFEKPTV